MEMNLKELFENTFRTNYHNFKATYSDQEKAAETALNFAKMIVQNYEIDQETIEEWSLAMYVEYSVRIELPKTSILRAQPASDWFEPKLLVNSFFWNRYQEYLSRVKRWPEEAVAAIDDSTNEIMKSLGNPNNIETFDKRGLVLGYVQSGKTTNFTRLINKAYDVGYKLIIVLSGIHNDLRAQTQLRLEEEVIGSRKDKEGNPIGVSQIFNNDSKHIISTWTTVEKDITSEPGGLSHLNEKTLMVVKKNKTVLESLKNQLEYHKDLFNLNIPVLIIDDEADQASVDTSDPNKKEDPKTINKLIRQILEVFERKCYVGYTATPFANLLIDTKAQTEDEGKDLYPKDFLVGLPKPKGYCGPEEFFNTEEVADDPRPSLIRYLNEADTEVFTGIKKKDDAAKFEEVPPQMKESIYAFLLTISLRNLRGQRNSHNSMLIHTSRFKDVQSSVKDEVAKVFDKIVNDIQYNPKSKVVSEIETLYKEDTSITSKEWPAQTQDFTWSHVYKELRHCAKTVQVFEINGNSKDALDYHQYKESGLNVIAVGGDKLSRGLTLEGLSISYYFRNSAMYDTLMQMGRWFGYRQGYMDLCRIYTHPEIAANFEHLAIAMVQLRQEFDSIARSNKTPLDYAVKMLSHPTMTLTSPLKMRNSVVYQTFYDVSLQQTRLFDKSKSFHKQNMDATNRFVRKISHSLNEKKIHRTQYLIGNNINTDEIISYLLEYKTSKDATKVDAAKMIQYINLAKENGELTNWTVAIVEGNPSKSQGYNKFPVEIGGISLKSAVLLGKNAHKKPQKQDTVDIGAIVAAKQEFIDFDKKDIANKKGEDIRRNRSKEKGVLLIYPLHPEVTIFKDLEVPFNKSLVPIGIALSFPGTSIDSKKAYEKNITVQDNE